MMAEGGNKFTEDEICSMLKALNVPVQKNELKSPTKEFIIRVFEHFLQAQRIEIEELRTFESTHHIEDADIYEEGQFLVLLTLTVQLLIEPTLPPGTSISIKDIVDPKPKKTKKLLYYILVFWNNYVHKFSRFCALEDEYDVEKKKAEDLMLKNQTLDEEYNKKCTMLKNMEPNKDELQSIVDSKKEKVKMNEKQRQVLTDEYADLKKKVNNIESQISEVEVAIATAKERLEELGQLILSSPERVNTEIQKLKDKIRIEDTKIKEKTVHCKENEKKLQITEANLNENEKALSNLRNKFEEVQKFGEIQNVLKKDQQKIDEEEDEVKRLQTEFQKKEDWKIHQHQKLCKIALNNKMELENLTALLETSKKEEAKLNEALELINAAINDKIRSIDTVSDRIIDINSKVKECNSKTKERAALYTLRVEKTGKDFINGSKSLSLKIKERFPSVTE